MEKMVSKEVDDFILDKDKTYWIATLSDGTNIYEDDGRPNTYLQSWLRLKNYCMENKLGVTSMKIKFRSHTEFVINCNYGAYFKRMALGQFGASKTQLFYIIGSLEEDGNVHTKVWQVPELIEDSSLADVRPLEKCENELIWNLSHPQLESLLAKLNISLN